MKMNQRWWKQRGDGGLADDGFRNKQSSLTLSLAVRKNKKNGTMRLGILMPVVLAST